MGLVKKKPLEQVSCKHSGLYHYYFSNTFYLKDKILRPNNDTHIEHDCRRFDYKHDQYICM